MSWLPSPIRGLVAGTVAILVFAALAGATYQGVATALERRRLPHPGRLVDIGGHQLHIACTGVGTPTVVLEAPAAGFSSSWGGIQPDIARVTRVCAYDRSGLGWSEAGDRGFDVMQVPGELHALLTNAHERGPFVLVGDGLGAAFATTFAGRYPDDTAALVRIDPPVPLQEADPRGRTRRLMAAAPWLARTGLLRATHALAGYASGLPTAAADATRSFLDRPDHLTRASREIARWDRARTLASTVTLPAALPIVDVTAAGPAPIAMLNERETAAPATAAILDAIARARARSEP